MRHFLLLLGVIGAGFATFASFEPLYREAQEATAQSGVFGPLKGGEPAPALADVRIMPIDSLRGTLRGQAERSKSPRKITLQANSYGHFHVQADINGQQVELMTDTGATYVALSYEAAQKLGLAVHALRFNGRSTTANGVARVASVTLDAVKIGEITVRNVQAVIAEPGKMSQNLLGMSFIARLSGFDLSGSRLVMTE